MHGGEDAAPGRMDQVVEDDEDALVDRLTPFDVEDEGPAGGIFIRLRTLAPERARELYVRARFAALESAALESAAEEADDDDAR